ncbi:potassium channel family protein [Agromyces arachidis]|uniref:potassium channel family protein n=1 Tax=Agromyces arachidis TaxID=766966 RepID=UPI004055F25A
MSAGRVGRVARRQRWIDATGRLLAVFGLAFIVAYVVWVLVPDLPRPVIVTFNVIFIVTWVLFLADAVMRITLTPRGERWHYVWTHPVELLSVLVPVFRALRVVTLIGHLPVLQRRTREVVRARFVVSAGLYAAVYVFFIALAVLQAERDAPGANIVNFGDAVWWAVVTLATVGYGDTYPVTTLGRVWAGFLMAGGVAIVGVASATVISILNERLSGLRHERNPERRDELIAGREGLDPVRDTGADSADRRSPDVGPVP